MDDFSRKFITEWRKLELPFENETFVIAVSGGADSCALALVLRELKIRKKLDHRFVVAHFDHLLRGEESAEDAKWVEDFAGNLGFEFVTGKAMEGEINKRSNVEQNARNARYRFLLETSASINAYSVLVGHTKNDQAETLLINLLRGSGLKGLSGMPVIRYMYQEGLSNQDGENSNVYKIVRPLLSWATREDTEEFSKTQNIKFRQDSMNENLDVTRVKVRKELIPFMQEFNPDIVETLARTAQILRDENSILEENEDRLSDGIQIEKGNLILKELLDLSGGELKRMIRRWLSLHRGGLRRLENKHIESITSLIQSKKSGREIELPGGERVIKRNGELFFRQTKVEK